MLSIDSSHKVFLDSNGIRQREVSLSVVISDLSLVFMRFTEEKFFNSHRCLRDGKQQL